MDTAQRTYELNDPYFVSVKIELPEGVARYYTVEVSVYVPREGWRTPGGIAIADSQEAARQKACELLQALVDGPYRDSVKEEARAAKTSVTSAELPSWSHAN